MNEVGFYRQQTEVTDPGDRVDLLTGIPDGVAELAALVQGAVLHRDAALWRFSVLLSDERYAEGETRLVRDILAMLGGLDERPPEQRFAGTCRDYCVLLCSMLRHRGVPARIRGGFANYNRFLGAPRLFDDHWVVEYWNAEHGWRLADGQYASPAAADYQVGFDPVDVPRDRFVVAGQAWLQSRAGTRDAERFIVSGLRRGGLPMIAQTVVRDLAALNKVEGFPWDTWGIMTAPFEDLGTDELELLDSAAEISAKGGPVDDARELYAAHSALRAE
ncbi:transglutaminase-like domain-containing protein [Streptomyces sp. NPDC058371]|uniref:transglutaminase-like domain-containing protein n=1 Tax=Streptomyces sp. NPDC058371 TaxID=3346463 RepID=UPI0036641817